MYYLNKLCQKCDDARDAGHMHDGNCTTTRAANYNMGDQREGGKLFAQKLFNCQEPLFINRVTTDADGCLAQGVISHMQSKAAGMETEHLLDPLI